MHKSLLETLYRKHHERGRRYGYLYCHGKRIPFLKKWIGTGKTVLDIGCRDGMLTQAFAENNRVIGVDIDQTALKLASRLGISTEWLDVNTEWPFETAAFDVIVACEILEHLFFLDTFLERVAKSLKSGGLFIGSVPNSFRIRNRLKFLMGKEYENDPTHVRQFSYENLEKTLNRYFSTLQIIPMEGKLFPFFPVSSTTPRPLSRLFAKDLLWKAQKN